MARANLRSDGDLTQPAVIEMLATPDAVETGLECEREVFGEEPFRPRTERHPVVEPVLRVAIVETLKDCDGHDGELVIGLKDTCSVINPV